MFSNSEQPNLLRKRSDLPSDDSCEKELSTDNSLLSLERSNAPVSDSTTLAVSQEPPLASVNAVISSVGQNRTKCPYCDELCPTETMTQHQDNCDKRKINCEACGEDIMIDIFDFHLEVCPNRVSLFSIYENYQSYGNYQNGSYGYPLEMNYGNHQDDQDEQDEHDEHDENAEHDDEHGVLHIPDGEENIEEAEEEDQEHEDEDDEFDSDTLTYEQLIYLDNFIVKKGMTAQDMEKIPVQEYQKEVHGVCGCSVCISDFECGESTRKLTCGHRFHKDCIDTWLETNITCPDCKTFLR